MSRQYAPAAKSPWTPGGRPQTASDDATKWVRRPVTLQSERACLVESE